MVSPMIRRAILPLLVSLSLAAMPACGNKNANSAANVTAGTMPDGESWNGVYFHPTFGHLHMVEEGENVVGRWRRTDSSAWGEMSGTKKGNLVRYTWKEHKIGTVGPGATAQGKGYFQYKMGKENAMAELTGEYGVDDEEAGSQWNCVKQQRMAPDLKSINGDSGSMGTPAGNNWQ
jgi:hypothetical protein